MRVLIFCFVFFFAAHCSAGVFDVVRSVPAKERLAKAQYVFNNQVKHKDSVFALASVKELITLANELDDRSLQCLSTSMLADQYARIRSINDLSTQLHKQAIEMAERFRLPLMVGICNYRMGRYYYSFKNYPFAFEYLLRADNNFHELGYKEVPDIDEILFFIGSIYYETGYYDKAETYLLNVQKLDSISLYIRKQSLNTLALIYKQENDTAKALSYFQKTLAAAIAQHDSSWIGICYSNIGSLYFSSNQYTKAYPLLEQGSRFSIARKQWGDAYSDLLFLARIDLKQNNTASAKTKIDSAIALEKFYSTMPGRKNLYEAQVLGWPAGKSIGNAAQTDIGKR
jgi:tetratricopeptide (TPR) repeat protein